MQGYGFWIVWAVLIAAIFWARSREKVEKLRTLQRLLERNEEIDEDLVNRLLNQGKPGKPGDTWRVLRASGAFVLVASIPVGVSAALMFETIAAGAVVLLMTVVAGLGLFLASRYYEKPVQTPEPGDSGNAWRKLRAVGVFVMAASIAVGVFVATAAADPDEPPMVAVIAAILGWLLTFIVGLGFFVASRFYERPYQEASEKE